MTSAHNNCHAIQLLHQIALVDGFETPKTFPSVIDQNIRTMQSLYPDARYRMWDGKSLRDLIASRFEASVLEAFDTLTPYTYKADLAKYCLLFLFGGLYADLDVRFLTAMQIPVSQGVASFRDVDFASPSWVAVNPKIVWAAPGRPEFRNAIDYIVENCRNRFYGDNSLYPTGPVLFGQALIAALSSARQHSANDQWIGSTREVTAGILKRTMFTSLQITR